MSTIAQLTMVGVILGVGSQSWAEATGVQRDLPDNHGPDHALMKIQGGWHDDNSLLESNEDDNSPNDVGVPRGTKKESKSESEAPEARPLALEYLKSEIALVASQIESLGPAPTSLTIGDIIEEMSREAFSPTATAVFERTIYSTLSVKVKARIDKVKAELTREGMQIQQTYVDNIPTSRDASVKKHLEAVVVEAATASIDTCVTKLKRAQQQHISSSNSTLRFERFQLLGDYLLDMWSEILLAEVDAIKKEARKAVEEHFHKRLGYVYNLADVDELIRALYEVLLRGFLVMEEQTDFEFSSSFEDKYSTLTESQLLAESCASERARLTQRKSSLISALEELEQL